jgi:eukaryotic-like serine/threonine-protein kinase
MGEVFAAVHEESGTPVALKVMKGQHSRKPAYLRAFREEVRSMARLDHPGLIMILDLGEVDAEAEAATDGVLHAGSPWMAMERASGGSLLRARKSLPFQTVKLLLVSLLDALSHAHARGVIHRDLKPANILLCDGGDLRPGVKVTDFGIAHAMRRQTRAETREAILGTPQYMAPEQCEGRFRDYGPWTDLYALGCIAYELSCGRRPFSAKPADGSRESASDLVRLQLNAPPPALDTAQPSPPEFEDWVHRLMAKDPVERFGRAADAAWALSFMEPPAAAAESMDEPVARPTVRIPVMTFDDATELTTPEATDAGWNPAMFSTRQSLVLDLGAVRKTGAFSARQVTAMAPESMMSTVADGRPFDEDLAPLQCWQAPPLPASWARQRSIAPPKLQDAGLRLFGLRTVPLVGRTRERDQVWSALMEVAERGRAESVVLRGPAGVGKSRLVEWLTQRAHEVGNATVLKAVHSPLGGPADGLGRMLAEHLRCHGLSRFGIEDRARLELERLGTQEDYEVKSLVELISPEGVREGDDDVVRLTTPMQRHIALSRFLDRLSRSRPVILWLDDAQWGADALGFAAHVMKVQAIAPMPVLVLVVAEDEALAGRPAEEALVGSLLERAGTREIVVGPLPPDDAEHLVSELLGLEKTLAARLRKRAGGNPLFAIQLVSDWIERGALERGPDGFRFAPGQGDELPDDIFAVWSARIDRVTGACAAGGETVIELAAVLGHDVDVAEWSWACRKAGVAFADGVVDELVASNLATRLDGAIELAGGMLRESMIRRIQDAGRWESHNRACAEMLRELYDVDTTAVGERLASHLSACGASAEAVGPLLDGARYRCERSEFRAAKDLIDRRERLLHSLRVHRSDPRWGTGWVLRARVCTLSGEVDAAQSWAQRAVGYARRHGAGDVLRAALSVLGRVHFRQGDPQRSEAVFEEALALHEAAGDEMAVADCLRNLGNIAHTTKNVSAEEEFFEQAIEISARLGDDLGLGMCKKSLAAVYRQRGELDRAKQQLRDALVHIERAGSRLELARLLNGVAEIARAEADLPMAEKGYQKALRAYEDVGSKEAVVPRLNLGLVAISLGDFLVARQLLEDGLVFCERTGLRGFFQYIHAALLPCAAASGDLGAFDRHYQKADTMVSESGVKDVDIAATAERAGEILAYSDGDRARLAFELAMVQWRSLDRSEDVSRVERAIARLP